MKADSLVEAFLDFLFTPASNGCSLLVVCDGRHRTRNLFFAKVDIAVEFMREECPSRTSRAYRPCRSFPSEAGTLA
jgi:hypothetical protein